MAKRIFGLLPGGSSTYDKLSAMRAEPVSLGFVIADGERVELAYDGDDLRLRFLDWREDQVAVSFRSTIAFRWQGAEEVAPDERFDAAHVIHESEWLAENVRQNEATPAHRHLKLNFNAAGCLEVICESVDVVGESGSPPLLV
jgi:hypothetical protein